MIRPIVDASTQATVTPQVRSNKYALLGVWFCITHAAQASVEHKYDLTGCGHRPEPVAPTGLQRIRLSSKYGLLDCKRRLSGLLRLQDTSMS